jgi:IS30 family transposase
MAVPMPNKTADSMELAIKGIYHSLPSKAFVTATNDRGGEFACFDNIKKGLGLTMYFADPYCAHQRGSNEYGNGLLREFFPKGTVLADVDNDDLTATLYLINNRPRKCLGWISAHQAFLHEVSRLD